jgi:biopolymer transport protein ExbD
MASHTADGEFGFQIAPMLDILFVLLLFFMVCAGVQKHEALISTALPGTGKGPDQLAQVNLEITDNGQVIFNGAATDTAGSQALPETVARLKAAIADAPNRPVIQPALDARQQRVVDVLNACKAAEVRNIAFGSATD